jgi:ATP-binding cassette subfamily F protein 3
MKIMAGIISADTGQIGHPTGMTRGYLPQILDTVDSQSLWNETRTAFQEVLDMQAEYDYTGVQIAERTDYESLEYHRLLERLSELEELLRVHDMHTMDERIERVLIGLGFSSVDFPRSTKEFSGGWRMRVELAKILLRRPDILLLDEPTNHLDIESIQWLEDFLAEYPGAVVMVSHDRAFLDRVTKRTVEISLGKVYDFKVPYSEYVILRREQRENQKAAYQNQQKLIADTEQFIERFRYKATKAVQVQSRIKQLDKLERIEIDPEDKAAMRFRFPPSPRSGSIVVEMKDLRFSFGTREVIRGIDMVIERGQKVAFVGKNGEGKTTLSRVITGELKSSGIFRLGHNTSIGYYAQNQDEILDGNKTVFETIDEIARGDIRTKIRDILGSFLFGSDDIDKKVRVLSGGERSRLALAKLLLEPVNLLVLDEPTNHLDMLSKDILKRALLQYDGTLLLVSHDRDFLDGMVEKIFEFKEGRAKEFTGTIWEFLEKKKLTALKELERRTPVVKEVASAPVQRKDNYLEKKDFERQVRKLQNQVQKFEKEIADLELKIAQIDKILSNPEGHEAELSDGSLFAEYGKCKSVLASKMIDWEKAVEEAEKFRIG